MPRVSSREREGPSAEARRNALVLGHLGLVHSIAKKIHAGLPAHVDLGDLVGAGMLGLLDAARKFNPKRRVAFRAYAKHRIRGAIIDGLRGADPFSRDMRRQQRILEEALARLNGKLQRAATEEEIAEYLGMPVRRWHATMQQLSAAGFPLNGHGTAGKPVPSVENLPAADGNPEKAAAKEELRRILDNAIATLPPRYRKVIALYYSREWTMKRIGQELGVNESRVSQIHSAAVRRLCIVLEKSGTMR